MQLRSLVHRPFIDYFPIYPKANTHRTAWKSPCFHMFPIHKNTSATHPWWIFRLQLNHSTPGDIPQLRTRHGMALAQFHRLGRKALMDNTHTHYHTMPVDTVVSVNAVARCIYIYNIHTWIYCYSLHPGKLTFGTLKKYPNLKGENHHPNLHHCVHPQVICYSFKPAVEPIRSFVSPAGLKYHKKKVANKKKWENILGNLGKTLRSFA